MLSFYFRFNRKRVKLKTTRKDSFETRIRELQMHVRRELFSLRSIYCGFCHATKSGNYDALKWVTEFFPIDDIYLTNGSSYFRGLIRIGQLEKRLRKLQIIKLSDHDSDPHGFNGGFISLLKSVDD